MLTKTAWIMFLILALSVAIVSQDIKLQSREDVKTGDLTDTTARKKLADRLQKVYGEGEYEIQELKMNTEQGEVAAGVEVLKTSEEITIDTTPCGKKKTLVTFHKEYKVEEVSDTTCNGTKYKRVQVEQR